MAFPDDWGRRCELVIQSAQVADTETNFPVLIETACLPSEIFDADGSYPALNGGGDIRFSSNEDGSTQIACEIEQFITDNDPANGKAAIWVKVPSVASASNTSIWIWYNKSGESQPAEDAIYGKEATWDSNFKMVQHMNQDPSGSSPQMIDSTSNDNDGTSNGTMLTADLVDGKIGKALDFEGTDDRIVFDDSASLEPGAAFTYSFLLKPSVVDSKRGLFSSTQDGSGNRTVRVDLFNLNDAFNASYIQVLIGNSSGSWSNVWYPNVAIPTGSYTKLDLTLGSNVVKIYKNGSYVDEVAYSGTSIKDTAYGWYLGYQTSGSYFPGIIDEFRMSGVARSAGWLETEYNNQNAPATFLIEGTPETPGAPAGVAPTGVFYGPLFGPFAGAIG